MSEESDAKIVPSSPDRPKGFSAHAETDPGKSVPRTIGPSFRTLVIMLVLSVGVSFPFAMVVERIQDTFGIPAEYDKYSQPPPEILVPMMAAARSAQRKNAALVLGSSGAVLGCILGLGLALGSTRLALRGALVGLVAGGLAGAIGGAGNAFLFQQMRESTLDELYQGMLVHAPAWLLIGLAAGGVVCLVNRSQYANWRILLAGAGAGLVSSAAFPILCLQAFPDAHPAIQFPDQFGSLVLWVGLTNGLITLAVIRAARNRSQASPQANEAQLQAP